MSRTWRALTVVACAALLAGACNKGQGPSAAKGTKSATVARINGQPVTQRYFEQRLEKMDRRFLPDTLDMAGKRKFLDFIINKELMAQKAEELKYGEDPRVVSAMQTYADNLASQEAIEQICKGKLDVTEPDIDEFFAKKHNKILAKHVLVKTRRQAEEVRKQGVAGTDFDTLVTRFSEVPRQDSNTGEALPVLQRAHLRRGAVRGGHPDGGRRRVRHQDRRPVAAGGDRLRLAHLQADLGQHDIADAAGRRRPRPPQEADPDAAQARPHRGLLERDLQGPRLRDRGRRGGARLRQAAQGRQSRGASGPQGRSEAGAGVHAPGTRPEAVHARRQTAHHRRVLGPLRRDKLVRAPQAHHRRTRSEVLDPRPLDQVVAAGARPQGRHLRPAASRRRGQAAPRADDGLDAAPESHRHSGARAHPGRGEGVLRQAQGRLHREGEAARQHHLQRAGEGRAAGSRGDQGRRQLHGCGRALRRRGDQTRGCPERGLHGRQPTVRRDRPADLRIEEGGRSHRTVQDQQFLGDGATGRRPAAPLAAARGNPDQRGRGHQDAMGREQAQRAAGRVEEERQDRRGRGCPRQGRSASQRRLRARAGGGTGRGSKP